MTALGQFYASDPTEDWQFSRPKQSLLVRSLRPATGCPVSHETGQFMSDYRIVIGSRKRRPVFHVELTHCEDGKAAQAILLGARQSARRPTGNRRETAFIIARASHGGVELTISGRPPSRRREGSSILDGARSPSGGDRPGGPSRSR